MKFPNSANDARTFAEKTFQLFRLYNRNHPILNASKGWRGAYYLALRNFTNSTTNIDGYHELFLSICTLLELEANVDLCNDDDLSHAYKVLKRTYVKKKKGVLGFF